MYRVVVTCVLAFFLWSSCLFGQSPASEVAPEAVGMSSSALAEIDRAVETEIARGQTPGAVVVVGRRGRTVFHRAYGSRALEPTREPMTPDTIFDIASLTKVVATATCVMILVERGRVRLAEPMARYVPEFGANGKSGVTIEQLLTHRSGLVADNPLEDYQAGAAKALENVWALAPVAEPGARFIYSDVNFIALGELVRRVSGRPLNEFADENVFRPLRMTHTRYLPPDDWKERIAPTEMRVESGRTRWMRGEVHDPRASALGGVAGHAGLFSTADDLARYCRMILNGGELDGARILSPLGVRRMTEARPSGGNGGDGAWRGLGWDVASPFSATRGDLFPFGTFGHTGFTGTSIWIEPRSQTFVIFLSNRVHPRLDPKRPADVTPLRAKISNIVAASILDAPPAAEDAPRPAAPSPSRASAPAERPVLSGVDVLEKESFAPLRGKRVGLITNHTGRTRDGRSTIDALRAAPGVTLAALFSPEHGIRGVRDASVNDEVDERTGLPIHSLYGKNRRPSPEALRGLDALVFDVQDVGARFYTYISTLGLAMEAAAEAKIPFVVLDRVNPVNGESVEGPIADADGLSFVAYHRIPVRHGMTVGELARLFNEERAIRADLTVVKLDGWERRMWFDATGAMWVNPSPNMRSLTQATLYPGVGLLEYANVSVGRGTDTPFELVGAPWIDGRKLAAALNAAHLAGVRFTPICFTPRASVFQNEECEGVNFIVTDRDAFEPVACGLTVAALLLRLHPKEFQVEKLGALLVNRAALEAVRNGAAGDALRQTWRADVISFRARREKYLLY
jgi:uncharacterized protein YbbC (DUF1343 family)/CubicO group peptidase (beta-lactamase class C family)